MKKLLVILLTVCSVSVLVAADIGTGNFPFLNLPADARNAGVSGASVASVDDITALYWNPGGLGSLQSQELMATYLSHIMGMNYMYAAYGQKAGTGAFAFSITFLSGVEQEGYDELGNVEDSFRNSSFAITGGYGTKLGERLSLGGNLRFANETAGGLALSGIMLDGGIQFIALRSLVSELILGLAVANIGFSNDETPALLRAGLTYEYMMRHITLAPMIDIDLVKGSKPSVNIGTEVTIVELYYVRLGYEIAFGGSDVGGADGLAIGVGGNFSGVAADISWQPQGFMGNTYIFSVGYAFKGISDVNMAEELDYDSQ